MNKIAFNIKKFKHIKNQYKNFFDADSIKEEMDREF
jgi:hypothetical protein